MRTVSLSFPRAPVSVVTAAVIVGEKLTVIRTRSVTIARRSSPIAFGAIESQGHAIHTTAPIPAIDTASVNAVSRAIALNCWPSRSRLSVRPAINAMSVVAMPVTKWS